MPGKKITELDAQASVSSDDLVPIVDDPSGSPSTKKITFANLVASISAIAAIAAASLTISNTLTLSQQPSGRILYTESGGVVTSTPNLTYTSTTGLLSSTGLSSTSLSVSTVTLGTSITGPATTTQFIGNHPMNGSGEADFSFLSSNWSNADNYVIFTDGTAAATAKVTTYGQFVGSNTGAQSYPDFAFRNNQDTGFYQNGARNVSFAIDARTPYDLTMNASYTTTTYSYGNDGSRTCLKMVSPDTGTWYVYVSNAGALTVSATSCAN